MRDNGPRERGRDAKRRTAEQIIGKLREAEVELAGGQTIAQACRKIGVSEQTFYRWRQEYGGGPNYRHSRSSAVGGRHFRDTELDIRASK